MAHVGACVGDALTSARRTLAAAGCHTPGLDAELLLADALGVPRARLVTHPELELTDEVAERFGKSVARRRRREPVAYITGRKAFRRLELSVDARVLIPRPDTETLVEAALELHRGARVLEPCTGSGAVARANGERLGLEVSWIHARGIAAVPGAPWDAVVANPPYVADGEELPAEIARHEPPEALWGGRDGLEVVRQLIAELGGVPWVALEVGQGQAASVRHMLAASGYRTSETRHDLAGVERVVIARR